MKTLRFVRELAKNGYAEVGNIALFRDPLGLASWFNSRTAFFAAVLDAVKLRESRFSSGSILLARNEFKLISHLSLVHNEPPSNSSVRRN